MPSALRKAVLTTHVATSVGWLGAVLGYFALDITAVASHDVTTVRGVYVAMEVLVRYAIVPLALAAVLIGIINALGTPWGLLRHYWVVVKLLLTLVATVVLLREVAVVNGLADNAVAVADPRPLSGTLVHSGGGLLVLLTTLVLSVYKPRGLTRYGWRKQQQPRRATTVAARRRQSSAAVGTPGE